MKVDWRYLVVIVFIFLVVKFLDYWNINTKEDAENILIEKLEYIYDNVQNLGGQYDEVLKISKPDKYYLSRLSDWGIVDGTEIQNKEWIVNSTGWYWVIRKNNEVFVVKLKYLYPLNNRYLEDHYAECLNLFNSYKTEISENQVITLKNPRIKLPIEIVEFPKFQYAWLLNLNALLYILWVLGLCVILLMWSEGMIYKMFAIGIVLIVRWCVGYLGIFQLMSESFLFDVGSFAYPKWAIFGTYADVWMNVLIFVFWVFFAGREKKKWLYYLNFIIGLILLFFIVYLLSFNASFTLDINEVMFYEYSQWFYSLSAIFLLLILMAVGVYLLVVKILDEKSLMKIGFSFLILLITVVFAIFSFNKEMIDKKADAICDWLENAEQLALFDQMQLIDNNLRNLNDLNDSVYFQKINLIEKSSIYLQLAQRILLEDSVQFLKYMKDKKEVWKNIYITDIPKGTFFNQEASMNIWAVNPISKKFLISVFDYSLPFNDKSYFSFLSDKIFQLPSAFKNFNVALYEDDFLKFKLGHILFPRLLNDWKSLQNIYNTHTFVIKNVNNKSFIVAYPQKKLSYFLSLLSTYFIFSISIAFLIIYIYFAIHYKHLFPIQYLSYSYKIPLMMVFLLLLSFYFLFYFTYNSVHQKLEKDIETDLIKMSESIDSTLAKNSAMCVFNFDGYIDVSCMSHPLIRLKLLPSHLSKKWLDDLRKQSQLFIKRKIGKYEYSALLKKIEEENKILEFSFYDERMFYENNLYRSLNPLFSIYAFLFLISILLGIIFSDFIVSPIQRISKSLKNIATPLGLQTISYFSNDEIGELVKNYNTLVFQLQEALEQLKKEQQEKAWKLMAQQVAHDIKNSLTPLLLNIEFLMKQNNLDASSQVILKSTLQQIQLLSKIAEDFSEFAQDFNVKVERVNLSFLIDEILKHYSGFDNVKFSFNKSGEVIEVNTDAHLLKRVLMNLINNSLDAIQENGKIVITLNELGNAYEISVSDNGCGIPDEIKDKIFEPHFSTKSSGKGLGLSIVKRICDKLKILISFESQKNQGTQFTLQIPKKREV